MAFDRAVRRLAALRKPAEELDEGFHQCPAERGAQNVEPSPPMAGVVIRY